MANGCYLAMPNAWELMNNFEIPQPSWQDNIRLPWTNLTSYGIIFSNFMKEKAELCVYPSCPR